GQEKRLKDFHQSLARLGRELRTRHADAFHPQEAIPAVSDDVSRLWRHLHLTLLRLPAADRDHWARRLADTAERRLGQRTECGPDTVVPALPGVYPERLDVPLPLTAEPETEPSPSSRRVREILDQVPATPAVRNELRPWAVRLEQAVRLLRVDLALGWYPQLEYPTWTVLGPHDFRSFGIEGLWQLATALGTGTVEARLESAQNLDEILGSVCHRRPARHGSWWWDWRLAVAEPLLVLGVEAGRRSLEPGEFRDEESDSLRAWCDGIEGEDLPGPVVHWMVRAPLRPAVEHADGQNPKFRGRIVQSRRW
ncbi:hypothetical protein, partial [Kitasatospora nipponensis]|uniref:hypothetical protein n=1 Tax=Kitasatospora nipponensis TaxID=258049 RepID=UPI0031D45B6A